MLADNKQELKLSEAQVIYNYISENIAKVKIYRHTFDNYFKLIENEMDEADTNLKICLNRKGKDEVAAARLKFDEVLNKYKNSLSHINKLNKLNVILNNIQRLSADLCIANDKSGLEDLLHISAEIFIINESSNSSPDNLLNMVDKLLNRKSFFDRMVEGLSKSPVKEDIKNEKNELKISVSDYVGVFFPSSPSVRSPTSSKKEEEVPIEVYSEIFDKDKEEIFTTTNTK